MILKLLIVFGILGLFIFGATYSYFIFNSNFGIPNVVDYNYGYPCNSSFVQDDNLFGYQFENCYILKLNWWNKK